MQQNTDHSHFLLFSASRSSKAVELSGLKQAEGPFFHEETERHHHEEAPSRLRLCLFTVNNATKS